MKYTMVNTPEVGDIVMYVVSDSDTPEVRNNNAKILPAVVVRVWSDTCVNLKIIPDGDGGNVWKTSVQKGHEPGEWFYRDSEEEE